MAHPSTFRPASFTQAPQQLQFTRTYDLPIQQVWAVLADHEGMTGWIPGMKQVAVKHAGSSGDNGLYCERECQFGPMLLKEKIVLWEPPFAYAYQIANDSSFFFKEHLGHFKLEKVGTNRTRVSWTQFFEPQGKGPKNWMMRKVMMPIAMRKALRKLEKRVIANPETPQGA